jgi:hypothetical protein
MLNNEVTYWELEESVSRYFNRLKGKIYNVIEASVPDKTQQNALKGLVKGFANDEWRYNVQDMRLYARRLKLLGEGEDCSVDMLSAEPLEIE